MLHIHADGQITVVVRNKVVVCKPNIAALLRATDLLTDRAVTALLGEI